MEGQTTQAPVPLTDEEMKEVAGGVTPPPISGPITNPYG